jgi:hypothetical protein
VRGCGSLGAVFAGAWFIKIWFHSHGMQELVLDVCTTACICALFSDVLHMSCCA